MLSAEGVACNRDRPPGCTAGAESSRRVLTGGRPAKLGHAEIPRRLTGRAHRRRLFSSRKSCPRYHLSAPVTHGSRANSEAVTGQAAFSPGRLAAATAMTISEILERVTKGRRKRTYPRVIKKYKGRTYPAHTR